MKSPSWFVRRIDGKRYGSAVEVLADLEAAHTDEDRDCVRRNALKSGYEVHVQ